jgi:hypothetical protein
MEVLLERPVVIGLAIAGAVFSTAASLLQARGHIGAARAHQLNVVGYAFMGASMVLFVIVGLRT